MIYTFALYHKCFCNAIAFFVKRYCIFYQSALDLKQNTNAFALKSELSKNRDTSSLVGISIFSAILCHLPSYD